MGKQSLSKGTVAVGGLAAKGAVSAGSPGFSTGSVGFIVIRQALSAGTTGVRSYGGILPANFVLEDIYLDVNTREQTASAKAISIGEASSGSAAFLSVVSTASVGAVQGSMVAGSVTYGSLLTEGTAASGRFRKNYIQLVSAGTLISQVSEAQTEFVGDIVLIGKLIG
jgi:hypothetical protein